METRERINKAVNTGLKLDVPSPEHYVLGQGKIPFEVLQENGNWAEYVPVFEKQKRNDVESSACVIFTMLNCIEILIKRKYGETQNYADAFLASYLDTPHHGGTTPVKAGDALRHNGTPKEEEFPFEKLFDGLDEKTYKLAKKFLDEWEVQYEFVPIEFSQIKEALKASPLLISWTAWFENESGLFYKLTGMTDNHATTLVGYADDVSWLVFDTYDTPYMKALTWELPMVAVRFHVEKKLQVKKKKSFWEWLKSLFA